MHTSIAKGIVLAVAVTACGTGQGPDITPLAFVEQAAKTQEGSHLFIDREALTSVLDVAEPALVDFYQRVRDFASVGPLSDACHTVADDVQCLAMRLLSYRTAGDSILVRARWYGILPGGEQDLTRGTYEATLLFIPPLYGDDVVARLFEVHGTPARRPRGG